MENTSDSFMPRPLLFCLKSGRSVCYSVPDNSLVEMKKGRPSKGVPQMKKEEARPLNESEREELIRLRAENEYIKAENEVIKKELALREERHAAQLKARKQRSSKSCVKKDTN